MWVKVEEQGVTEVECASASDSDATTHFVTVSRYIDDDDDDNDDFIVVK